MTLALRIIAVLIALRGSTNVFKPFGSGSAFVFFGQMLPHTSVLGPLVGIFMLIYAYGLWTLRGFALPMGVAYAVFATLNIVLFYFYNELPAGWGPGAYLLFALVGIAVPWAAVVLLQRARRSTPATA
jgi:hypothetical protein